MARLAADELEAFVDSLTRLLAEHGGEVDVRRATATPLGFDPHLWRALGEIGLLGLIVDEAHGGIGAGAVELERVMEVVGASLVCGPILASSVLAASLLTGLGDGAANARLLPGIVAGTTIAAVALTGTDALAPADAPVAARPAADRWHLTGDANFVMHAGAATVLLVVTDDRDGAAVFAVDPRAPGVSIAPLETFDRTLRLSRVTLRDAPAARLGAAGSAAPALAQALTLARVALAGEQAGGARRVLDMTVDYIKNRFQFGRAVGSFQALKHMAADLLLETESSISAARHAAECVTAGAPDAAAAVSLAAFTCAEAFTTVTAASIQMHGGIAFTWDHPAHLYLRRARADAALFGAPDWHRERYLQALEAAA